MTAKSVTGAICIRNEFLPVVVFLLVMFVTAFSVSAQTPEGFAQVKGKVDWSAARRHRDRKKVLTLSVVQPDVAAKIRRTDVPVLLPGEFLAGLVTQSGGRETAGAVTFLNLKDGYTASLPGVRYDILIDATAGSNEPADSGKVGCRDFVGKIEGDYGVTRTVNVGKFCVNYYFQFQCNIPAREDCVSDGDVLAAIENLVTLGGRGLADGR